MSHLREKALAILAEVGGMYVTTEQATANYRAAQVVALLDVADAIRELARTQQPLLSGSDNRKEQA